MIRSSKNRERYYKQDLPAHGKSNIHRGDILILNEDYGQYKAEVQISLMDRPYDPRINVVGHILEEEMILIDCLKPFQSFQFQIKE